MKVTLLSIRRIDDFSYEVFLGEGQCVRSFVFTVTDTGIPVVHWPDDALAYFNDEADRIVPLCAAVMGLYRARELDTES